MAELEVESAVHDGWLTGAVFCVGYCYIKWLLLHDQSPEAPRHNNLTLNPAVVPDVVLSSWTVEASVNLNRDIFRDMGVDPWRICAAMNNERFCKINRRNSGCVALVCWCDGYLPCLDSNVCINLQTRQLDKPITLSQMLEYQTLASLSVSPGSVVWTSVALHVTNSRFVVWTVLKMSNDKWFWCASTAVMLTSVVADVLVDVPVCKLFNTPESNSTTVHSTITSFCKCWFSPNKLNICGWADDAINVWRCNRLVASALRDVCTSR